MTRITWCRGITRALTPGDPRLVTPAVRHSQDPPTTPSTHYDISAMTLLHSWSSHTTEGLAAAPPAWCAPQHMAPPAWPARDSQSRATQQYHTHVLQCVGDHLPHVTAARDQGQWHLSVGGGHALLSQHDRVRPPSFGGPQAAARRRGLISTRECRSSGTRAPAASTAAQSSCGTRLEAGAGTGCHLTGDPAAVRASLVCPTHCGLESAPLHASLAPRSSTGWQHAQAGAAARARCGPPGGRACHAGRAPKPPPLRAWHKGEQPDQREANLLQAGRTSACRAGRGWQAGREG